LASVFGEVAQTIGIVQHLAEKAMAVLGNLPDVTPPIPGLRLRHDPATCAHPLNGRADLCRRAGKFVGERCLIEPARGRGPETPQDLELRLTEIKSMGPF
jgi:hypothetical protein